MSTLHDAQSGIRVVSVHWRDCFSVGGGDDIGYWPNTGVLDDAGVNVEQRRCLSLVDDAVGVAFVLVHQPAMSERPSFNIFCNRLEYRAPYRTLS